MKNHSDFAATYENMSDGQLLKISNEGNLVEEAGLALTHELRRRNLTNHDFQRHQEPPQEKLQNEVKERWFPLGRRLGFGLYGRTYLNEGDRLHNIQTRTKFFVLGIPLIPIASYRLRYKNDRHGWFQLNSDGKALSRVPLLWSQVVMTWIKTLLLIAAIIGFFALLDWIRHFAH